jgi:hypothetical protein
VNAKSSSNLFLTRAIVVVNAVVFVAFGLAFLAAPEALAATLGIELGSTTALADFRAIYGGLTLACGVLFFLSLSRAGWLPPSLFLVAASSAGLLVARIYSTLVSGVPSPIIFVFCALEFGSFLWAALCYRKLSAETAQ